MATLESGGRSRRPATPHRSGGWRVRLSVNLAFLLPVAVLLILMYGLDLLRFGRGWVALAAVGLIGSVNGGVGTSEGISRAIWSVVRPRSTSRAPALAGWYLGLLLVGILTNLVLLPAAALVLRLLGAEVDTGGAGTTLLAAVAVGCAQFLGGFVPELSGFVEHGDPD